MADAKVGIIYATASGIVRRWIVPDNDVDLSGKHSVMPGETLLIVERSTIKSPADVDAAVAVAIGKPVPSARCAVIDGQGNIVGSMMADPALDTVPGHTLMLHTQAGPGWTMRNGSFTPAPVVLRARRP